MPGSPGRLLLLRRGDRRLLLVLRTPRQAARPGRGARKQREGGSLLRSVSLRRAGRAGPGGCAAARRGPAE
nr:hypothetical protein [Streptomyces sp. ISL-12]